VYYTAISSILAVMIITVSIIPVFAQNSESITIDINKETYTQGDTIVVFGQINKMISGLPDISIQIYHAGNLVFVAQPKLAADGTYAESIFASGKLWKTNGTYLVRVFYTEEIIAETNFKFYNTEQTIDPSSTLSVNIPNASEVFDVGYAITTGEVTDIQIDKDNYSLIVDFNIDAAGNIVLSLPRDSFDAKTTEGSDDAFIVLITNISGDTFEVEYEEVQTNTEYRTIKIPFVEGDYKIQLIGTYVIPEFGTIAIMILLVSIISVIILSKNKFPLVHN
jgi:predicted secreted protein with PEFG-CTERM motif